MRTLRTLAALLIAVPALALAQDGSGGKLPDPKGQVLLAATPTRADLVVHTPDLPALLASAEEAGLGSPKAWRAAFDAQMQEWGKRTGIPERLVEGAGQMLRAADGEVLIAGIPLPPIEGPARATVLAFRTSQTQARMKNAIEGIVEGGLRGFYAGAPRTEEIHGRPVLAMPGIEDTLYVAVQDGLVVASDHPLAMGLFFRGLERVEGVQPAGKKLLEVRFGRGDKAWTGWMYGGRESVSWTTDAPGPITAPLPPGLAPIVSVAAPRPMDLPVLPIPAPFWVTDLPALGGQPVQLCLPAKGGLGVSGAMASDGTSPRAADGDATLSGERAWAVVRGAPGDPLVLEAPGSGGPVAGGATHLGWLDGWAGGRLALPVPSIDRALLAGPLGSAKRAGGTFLAWTATDQAGELRGPRWHGPCTFLMFRTIHGIATKTAPGETLVKKGMRAPLPPISGGAELPKPVKGRDEAGGEK